MFEWFLRIDKSREGAGRGDIIDQFHFSALLPPFLLDFSVRIFAIKTGGPSGGRDRANHSLVRRG